MKFGNLLNQLVEIAGIPKTDFAIYLNFTPSALSKILSGTRLPSIKEKKHFLHQAANYISEALFVDKCYYLFKNIFPVLYDFISVNELERFFIDALDYAILQDYASANGESHDFPDRSYSYLGTKSILNHFCIIASDFIMEHSNEILDIHSCLPLFDPNYKAFFERVCILNQHSQQNISFHHYASVEEYEDFFIKTRLRFLSMLAKVDRFADISLYTMEKRFESPFFLVRNYFELHFSVQMDGTPVMTLIMNSLYHLEHYFYLSTANKRKMNVSGAELCALISANPALVQEYSVGKLLAVYNFLPIAYFLRLDDLAGTKIDEDLFEIVSDTLLAILQRSQEFFITSDALHSFLLTGKIMLPAIGEVTVAKEKRVACIERFSDYAQTDVVNKIRVIRQELPKTAIVCTDESSILYFAGDGGRKENFIYFKSNVLSAVLSEEINSNNLSIMAYNSELWAAYFKKIKSDATKLSH